MKKYFCKKCDFKGSRKEVRKHLIKEHWVQPLNKANDSQPRQKSSVSLWLGREEWKA